MKFNKIYTEWVLYLKKKGIYGQYMIEYARVNEYLTYRGIYLRYHTLDSISKANHKFLNSKDLLIEKKTDENMTFKDLMDGIERFEWNMFFLSKHNWRVILEDFGAEFGYYKKPKKNVNFWSTYDEDDDYTLSATDIANSRSIVRTANTGRYRGREEANIGQWYDVYYQNNRNRNRFINNVRWRR